MRTLLLTWRLVSLATLSLVSFFILGLFLLSNKSSEVPRSVKDSQGGARRVKHTHLVSGDPAGRGLAGRVQCEGPMSLSGNNMAKPAPLHCLPAKSERILFATFFVSPPVEQLQHAEEAETSSMVEFGNVTIHKADRPYAVLSIFLQSVQITIPDAVTAILTDERSPISTSRLPGHVQVYRTGGNFTRENLMLQRLESYVYFLEESLEKQSDKRASTTEHIIFMDADIMVVGGVHCIFEAHESFDMVLTFRNNKDQPINSGVIMVRGEAGSMSRASKFLLDVVKVYRAKFAKATRMLGDQLSLAAVVREHCEESGLKFKRPVPFTCQVENTRVLFLPSQVYNWTPSEGAGQFHGMPEDVKVLHFKGSRKRLMIEAWNLYMRSGRNVLDMECLILRSGRAKYDF